MSKRSFGPLRAASGIVRDGPVVLAVLAQEGRTERIRAPAIRLSGSLHISPRHDSLTLVIGFALAALLARPAAAQAIERPGTPTELFEPEQGNGARLAPYLVLYPTITIDAVYDTNVYNTDTDERSDGILRARPEALLASDFARHSVELRAGAELRKYADNTDEDAETFHLDSTVRLDLGEQIDVTAQAGYASLTEQRGSAGDQFFSDEPIAFDRKYVALAVSRFRAQLGLALDGRVTTLNYDDATLGGTPVFLGDRDVTVRQLNFRTSYRLQEGLNLFGQVGGNEVDYRTIVSSTRDSSGWSALAGVQLQPSAALNFEVGAGYLKQTFDNPQFDAVKAINYRLSADWLPRRTWKLRAEVSRNVDPSPRNDTPAIVRSEFRLGVQHSLGDRTLLEASASSTQDNYREIDRTDRYYRVGLSGRHRLNSSTGITADIGYRTQSGGRDYSGFHAGAGVRFVF